ncbi:MAG: DNA internalization-related competence protein ComEC/Rec2 [Candidatus Kapaibacterium sp.]
MKKLYTAPAFKLAVVFSIGILAGKYFSLEYYITIPALLILIVSYFLFKKKYQVLKFIILLVIIILTGLIKSNIDFRTSSDKSINLLDRNISGIFLVGTIDNLPEYSENRVRFTVDASELISRNDTLKVDGRILVLLKQTKILSLYDSFPRFEAGDKVILFGSLRDAPDDTNPGEFNYREYLALNDIHKTFKVSFWNDAEVLSKNNLNFFEQNIIYPSRKYAIENINRNIGGEEAAFLNGLVTGYRADFSKELKEDFIKAGVMHLIAVSGLNVAYIIIFLTVAFSLLRVPFDIKIYLMIAALVFYMFFTGAAASIVRAVLMGSVMLINYKVQRKINFYNVIGISALIILLFDSKQLFNSGFILSFSAVISIVIIFNRVNLIIGKKIKHWNKDWRKVFYYIYITLLTTVAAQIGVLPITLSYFGKISIVGIFTNIIAIPLSNLSLALGFIQIIFGVFSDFLGGLIAEVNYLLLHYELAFIKWAANLPYSSFDFYGITLAMLITFYVILLLLLLMNKSNFKYNIALSVLVIAAYFIITGFKDNNLKITYLSLGNSDCTHLETPDGSNILIDIGVENQYNASTSRRIIPYLKRKSVRDLDLVILTSPIGKNYKSLRSIIENFNVKKILFNDKSEISGNTEKLIIDNKIQVDELNSINEINGYGGLRIKCFKTDSVSGNAMLKIYFGNKSFLFPGKAETENEIIAVRVLGNELKSDVLKVAKYGSVKSTSDEFLQYVNPFISVISSSGIEERNLPAYEVLRRLEKHKSEIYRTDEHGAVILESDGNYLKIK